LRRRLVDFYRRLSGYSNLTLQLNEANTEIQALRLANDQLRFATEQQLGEIRAQLSGAPSQHDIARLERTLNLIGRQTAPISDQARVLFIVHFMPNWSSLEPIYQSMREAEDFDPIVVSVDYNYVGDPPTDEAEVHEYLEGRGIPHLRWGSMDNENTRYLLRYLAPDLIFRQSQWEGCVDPALRTSQSGFFRICNLPYALDLVADIEETINQEFHHAAWRVFVPSELHVRHFQQHSRTGGRNVYAVGHPGLDSIWSARSSTGRWPFSKKDGGFRILWAPHHSVTAERLNFGTIHLIWRDMLMFARENPAIEIVMRPHHIMFEILERSKLMTAADIDEFLSGWNALPNTSIDREPEYALLFAAADILLTDGISFLGEFQVTGKPVVFIEREGHWPFSIVGERVVQGTYRCADVQSALEQVLHLRNGGQDPLSSTRSQISSELILEPGNSASLILDEIRRGLKDERRRRHAGLSDSAAG